MDFADFSHADIVYSLCVFVRSSQNQSFDAPRLKVIVRALSADPEIIQIDELLGVIDQVNRKILQDEKLRLFKVLLDGKDHEANFGSYVESNEKAALKTLCKLNRSDDFD